MSWQLDFTIATGIFLIFFSALISYLTSFRLSSISYISASEKEEISSIILNSLFSGKGIPSNWEQKGIAVKIGLQTELFRIPLIVKEENGTSRFATINISLDFDPNCLKKAWNNTVRVYENETEIPFQLYNQNFCSEQYLKNSTLLFSSYFDTYEEKYFLVYFSDDRGVLPSNYSVQPSEMQNFSVSILPEQKFSSISVSKLEALRNLSYEEVSQILGDYNFYFEVSS
ncbi:MAG: hypothetical protein QXP77_02145 [Candidatus Aenigmatarchaeota archaeon]